MKQPIALLIVAFVLFLVLGTIGIGFAISDHLLTQQVLGNRAHGVLLQQILCVIVHHDHLVARGCS